MSTADVIKIVFANHRNLDTAVSDFYYDTNTIIDLFLPKIDVAQLSGQVNYN
jgi:hypothetical protein